MRLEKIFNEFIEYSEKEKLYIEGIAIADEVQVLMEHHFTPDLPRNIYSHTKSYMATATGIAIEEGKLSLDNRLADFFPEYLPKQADSRLSEITLRNLLTMSSGFHKPYLMGKDRREGIGMPDYMEYMMSRPIVCEPGSRFLYSTADSILAGRMIEKAVGMRLGVYLYERLFRKLNQGWPQWENDPQGHPIGGGGMHMTLTDMMKLGQLYLADGIWKGEQLISHNWIQEATKKQIDTEGEQDIWKCGYGYQFWMSPYPKAYRADGAYGQITTVLPEQNLVVAVQCPEYGDFEKVKRALHTKIFLPIIKD